MKVLWRKFNKTKLSVRLVYIFVALFFIAGYSFLFKSLLLLDGIETSLRIIALCVLGVILLLYLFFDLLLLLTKKHKTVLFTSFLMMLISSICIIGSLAINKVYGLLDNMSKDTVLYTTNLITMKNTTFKNDASFKVGMINNETDTEGNVLAYELIEEKDLKVTVEKYDTYFELLEKLYNGELNGIFITSNYIVMYEGYDAYEKIGEEVKVEFEYSKEMENQDYIESKGSVEEPFTVLLMGVDSTSNKLNANAAFNGDTIMIITFNPHTLNATVFSIPRDTYVPIACLKNSSSKINSSAAYGTQCVINTVQNLIDINIDYYVKINFKGVVDLVNALGGVDVTVPDKVKFCEQNSKRSFKKKDLICINPGFQHMNGEQALAFARHRKTLPAGDFQRVQHQQLVVEGIANSAKNLSSMNDFMNVLDAVSINMDTNMQTSEMLNLYNVGKDVLLNANDGFPINIQKTYLTGYDLSMYVDNLRAKVYTFQYYEQSLAEIVSAMKVNLELESPEVIKTFNFSINDEYEIPVIGKKYYTVQRNEVIPNFVKKQNVATYAQNWCEARNINVVVKYVTPESSLYDATLKEGTIVKQDVPAGKLTTTVTQIVISVIKHPVQQIVTTTTKYPNITSSPTSTSTTTQKVEEQTTSTTTQLVDQNKPDEDLNTNTETE